MQTRFRSGFFVLTECKLEYTHVRLSLNVQFQVTEEVYTYYIGFLTCAMHDGTTKVPC